MNKIAGHVETIHGFCAGLIFWNFSDSREEAGTPEEHLKFLFERHKGYSGMMFMGDCEGGKADRLLFAPLIAAHGHSHTFSHQEGMLGYSISPYYFNKNSGNMCRHLTVWLELSEDAIQEWRDENAEEEPEEEECYCEDCQEARRNW